MRKVLLFILLIASADTLYAKDIGGRQPNSELDYGIYADIDIEKSGNFYFLISPGISLTSLSDGKTGFNLQFPQAEYIASLTFGSNFHKYFGTELTVSNEGVIYHSSDSVEYIYSIVASGYITLRYAFQPKYNVSIIPYLAVGINAGVMIIPGASALLPENTRLYNDFNGIKYSYMPAFGLASKAGLRFKINDFVFGLGVIYNMSVADLNMKKLNIALELGFAF